jgi:hypothetical protein
MMKFLLGMKPLWMPKNGLTINYFDLYIKRSRKGSAFFGVYLFWSDHRGQAIRYNLSSRLKTRRFQLLSFTHFKRDATQTHLTNYLACTDIIAFEQKIILIIFA